MKFNSQIGFEKRNISAIVFPRRDLKKGVIRVQTSSNQVNRTCENNATTEIEHVKTMQQVKKKKSIIYKEKVEVAVTKENLRQKKKN